MAISAADVKALRDRTGMGMMECKAALTEADGDTAAAVEILRANAKGKMDERTDREAVEGAIAVAQNDTSIAIVELNTETDFTARNDGFVDAAQKIADISLGSDDGVLLGVALGCCDRDGDADGDKLGCSLGSCDGDAEGEVLGLCDSDGVDDGISVGPCDGTSLGDELGSFVGSGVIVG